MRGRSSAPLNSQPAARLLERGADRQDVALHVPDDLLSRQCELVGGALRAAVRILRLELHRAIESDVTQHGRIAEDVDEAHTHRHVWRGPAAAASECIAGERQWKIAIAATAAPAAAPTSSGGRSTFAAFARFGRRAAPGSRRSGPASGGRRLTTLTWSSAAAATRAAASAGATAPGCGRSRRALRSWKRPAFTEKTKVLLPGAILPPH